MSGDNIVVAVRVRGFNKRESEMNSELCVKMQGPQTVLVNNAGILAKEPPERNFAFDYSYWSFDGYKEEESGYLAPDSPTSKYADQQKLYDELGAGILTNAFNGYNCGLFAYGQTGAGKSYSISGTRANKGIVPQVCVNLFNQIEERKLKDKDSEYEVTFSMIEIYSEQVRDLLSSKPQGSKGLPIHERPGKGFHILEKDMKPITVLNYDAIETLIEQGNKHKSIAATSMNAVSSRAHTIVELCFKHTYKNETGSVMQRESIINLIDLAGSERVSKSQTTGQQFKEGVAINQSLNSLGNCISALCKKSEDASVRIPYRDSNLTKLLMNTLGGNSKTIMIAAISPSENNYPESLSTLRYADRAKQIKCNAIVNEDPKDKIILSLQDEIAKLKSMMGGGTTLGSNTEIDLEEYERSKKEMAETMRKQIEENELYISEMKKSYETRLAEAVAKTEEMNKKQNEINEKSKVCAHISNINVDPQLTGSVKYLLEFPPKKKELMLGTHEKNDIVNNGIGVLDKHAKFTFEKDEFYLHPFPNARVIRNGKQEDAKFKLNNFDRLVIGASLYYLFIDPRNFDKDQIEQINDHVTSVKVETIQQEIAEVMGLISGDSRYRDPDEIACMNELIDLMPSLEEANSMSIGLDKKMKYKPIILNPVVIGEPKSKVRPLIIAEKFGTSCKWLWDIEKFINRKACMSEMYLEFKQNGLIDIEKYANADPFLELETEPTLIGTALVEPKCILHKVPLDENSKIYDYLSKLVGTLRIELVPCDKQGIAYSDIGKHIVQNPEKHLKDLYFLLRINTIKLMTGGFKKIYCQFKLFGDEVYNLTADGGNTSNPTISYQKVISYDKVDPALINDYATYPLFVQVHGVQISLSDESKKKSTKDWFTEDSLEKKQSEKQLREELKRMQTELEKAKQKMKDLNSLLIHAQNKNKKKIKIQFVKDLMGSNNPETLNNICKQIDKREEKDD